MITQLHVENFKSLRSIDVNLEQLSVIVGPNGCGKSSVLQAIELLWKLNVQDGEGDAPPLTPDLLSIEGEERTQTGSIAVSSMGGDSLKIDLKLGGSGQLEGSEFPFFAPSPNRALGTIQLYRLDRRVMEQPAYADEPNPSLGSSGEGLAEVLDALHGDQPDRFAELEDTLREMVPGFRRLRIPRRTVPRTGRVLVDGEWHRGTDQAIGHQVVFDFDHARGIAAEHASEGTLLLLGLLTILATHEGPMTMMLDDLDRALHPRAQKQLVEHLRTLLKARPDLQILATSHSPYLIEHLDYEEVLAMTQSTEDGQSYIAPLLDHPEAERWREEMSAGEFWGSFGEDWVRDAKAG